MSAAFRSGTCQQDDANDQDENSGHSSPIESEIATFHAKPRTRAALSSRILLQIDFYRTRFHLSLSVSEKQSDSLLISR